MGVNWDTVGMAGTRARAHEVNQHIIEDHGGLPNFDQANQNIATAAVVLARLPEPATSDERRDRDKMRIFLERALAESSI